jgi:tRNA threonylcarbamoyladenosine biosynthesis protein TsaE
MKKLKSFSLNDTKKIGAKLAQKIIKIKTKNAIVAALFGDLGSGKTTLIKGFLFALGIRKKIISPTFILMRKFHLKKFNKNVYHLDLYRILKNKDLKILNLDELIKDPQNILLIEWPEKILKKLPKKTIKLYLKHGNKESEREIIFKNISL